MHVPELLRRTGFPIDIVITPDHPLRSISGISNSYVAVRGEWSSVVERRLLSGEYACFLNVDEPGIKALYKHSWSPAARKFLPVDPDLEVAATIHSKAAFFDWCVKNGLPVPETRICADIGEARALLQHLSGSWFLKGDTGSGGQTVRRCMRDSPACNTFPSEAPGKWLLQRDEGPDVGSGIFLADQGRVLSWMGVKKIVCLNKGLGPTVLGHGDAGAEVGDLCRRVAAASSVTGLTGFDFVRSRERGLLLIDSHLGRMSPMLHFDRLYGVDFASALRVCLQEKSSAEAPPPRPGPAFIKFPEVLQLCLEGGTRELLINTKLPTTMPLSPPGDPLTGLSSACSTLISQSRVTLGGWRRHFLRATTRML